MLVEAKPGDPPALRCRAKNTAGGTVRCCGAPSENRSLSTIAANAAGADAGVTAKIARSFDSPNTSERDTSTPLASIWSCRRWL